MEGLQTVTKTSDLVWQRYSTHSPSLTPPPTPPSTPRAQSCKGPRATSYYNEDMGSLCFTRNVYILRTPPLESQWPMHENRGEALQTGEE